eukprot:gb/GEZN01008209.1/.p1 GENE.gb/GEZN01008209.1/~~gb/GEZN01008209.1/.p1  ORF type:complete len:375 (-),score=84.21 gb/GEZN01008209.1/:119-1243(-)
MNLQQQVQAALTILLRREKVLKQEQKKQEQKQKTSEKAIQGCKLPDRIRKINENVAKKLQEEPQAQQAKYLGVVAQLLVADSEIVARLVSFHFAKDVGAHCVLQWKCKAFEYIQGDSNTLSSDAIKVIQNKPGSPLERMPTSLSSMGVTWLASHLHRNPDGEISQAVFEEVVRRVVKRAVLVPTEAHANKLITKMGADIKRLGISLILCEKEMTTVQTAGDYQGKPPDVPSLQDMRRRARHAVLGVRQEGGVSVEQSGSGSSRGVEEELVVLQEQKTKLQQLEQQVFTEQRKNALMDEAKKWDEQLGQLKGELLTIETELKKKVEAPSSASLIAPGSFHKGSAKEGRKGREGGEGREGRGRPVDSRPSKRAKTS